MAISKIEYTDCVLINVLDFLRQYQFITFRSFRNQFVRMDDSTIKEIFGPGWKRTKLKPTAENFENLWISPRRYFQHIYNTKNNHRRVAARLKRCNYFDYPIYNITQEENMDKKIKKLQKKTKELEKGETALLKADKKRDKAVDAGKKVMKKTMGKAKKS